MNKIHALEITQYKDKSEDDNNYPKIAMPRIVYVHEGFDGEKYSENRNVLKNVRYFGGIYENSEDLWLEVCNYIYEQYIFQAMVLHGLGRVFIGFQRAGLS